MDELYARSNLTQRQLLMWIGQKVQAWVPDMNMASLFRVHGRLDEIAFARAVRALVESTDSLRTVIEEVDGVPMQRVVEPMDVRVEVLDLRDEADPEGALAEAVDLRARAPFMLERRLFHFALFHLADDASAWFVNVHHIISDGWSMRLLFERLSELYQRSLASDRTPPALPLPRFAAYVEEERRYARTEAFAADERYWASSVAAAEPVSFYGKPVPSGPTEGRRQVIELGPDRTRRLRELAEANGHFWGVHAALQNLLAAALFAYVHRVGANPSPTVAMVFHNRGKGTEETMGLVMQTLPVRVDVSDDDSFYTLLEKVTEASLGALEHRGCAVANPLHKRAWDVILNYLPTDFSPFAGLDIAHEWVFCRHVNSALSVTAHDFAGSGSLTIDFDTLVEAFDEPNGSLAPAHFLAMIDAMLDNVYDPIHKVDILSAEERERMLLEASGPPARPVTRTYVEWYEDTVRRRPEKVGLWVDETPWTLREVNEKANRLAHYLMARGAGPGELVGICVRPGVELAVAVLAVLKAGAGYLALDPSYPTDRLAFMIEDGNARVIVTERTFVDRIGNDGPLVVLDGEAGEAIARCSAANPAPAAGLDDVAYIIYTSGSTGRPKGVRVQHRSLVSFLEAIQDQWIGEDDILPQTSPLSFDMHVGDLLLPLVLGARLTPVRREIAADGARLQAVLDEIGATAFFATPATFRLLIDSGWRGRPGLRVLCGGEAMSMELARDLLARVGSLRNVYGPSETTCYVLSHPVTEADAPIPIGRPLPGVRAYVLDVHGMPLPVGMAGELVIGGPQVALDYLRRPELTAAKFLDDRFSPAPDARMYRSGDLVRMRPDGVVEYLGRIDHQVKIRGYRIELGEIETALGRFEGVRESLVMAREDTPGDKRLVAYLVSEGLDLAALKAHLRQTLPEFMVPSAYVVVAEFPITPSGKVDRQKLPAPERQRDLASDADAPRDLLCFQITKIFEDVLGIQPVGIHDSFFELGGNSLLAVKLLAQIERMIDRQIPSLMTLFEAPSPHQLAGVLSRGGWQPALGSLVPLQPSGDKTPLFCVHAFIGDVCRDLGRNCGPDNPFFGLQPRGLDGREEPLRTIPEMASYYISEMRKAQPQGPYNIAGYSFGGLVAAEMAAQLEEAGQKVDLLAIIDVAPVNMRPRTLAGRLRALVNAPLVGFEKLARKVREEPMRRILEAAWRRVRGLIARRRGKGAASAEALAVVERMYGMSRWPNNYQKIARINLLAMMAYRPRPYSGPITLIRRRSKMYRHAFETQDWGWRELAPTVDVRFVDGNHDELMVEPGVRQVGAVIQECLQRSELDVFSTRTKAVSEADAKPPSRAGH
jgi:amino acid adenylation domain-containing protein